MTRLKHRSAFVLSVRTYVQSADLGHRPLFRHWPLSNSTLTRVCLRLSSGSAAVTAARPSVLSLVLWYKYFLENFHRIPCPDGTFNIMLVTLRNKYVTYPFRDSGKTDRSVRKIYSTCIIQYSVYVIKEEHRGFNCHLLKSLVI